MTNARPQKETGAVMIVPGGHDNGSALHAEDAFIGAVLHLPVSTAKQALDLVHDDDLADLLNQRILEVARLLVAAGTPPDPVAILARARADGIVAGSTATQALALHLSELYAGCPTPASWCFYGLAVIDEALRRQCIAMGTRVLQGAESCSLDVLIDLLDAECRLVRRLHDRRAAAAPTQLRAVAG